MGLRRIRYNAAIEADRVIELLTGREAWKAAIRAPPWLPAGTGDACRFRTIAPFPGGQNAGMLNRAYRPGQPLCPLQVGAVTELSAGGDAGG